MSPVFSVIIPSYNRAHLVSAAIDSVLAQDFRDFELLIVDDGSTDNTEEVVGRFDDSRLTYFKIKNGERGAARNLGRSKSKGEYVNFFDSDDLMYPHHLSEARKLIDARKEPEFFHLAYDFRSPEGIVTKHVNAFDERSIKSILFDNNLSCNGIFIRKDIASQFPFVEDRTLASAEDWQLWIRLIARYPLHFSNQVTTSVISHDLRSIRTIPIAKIIDRDLLLIRSLAEDPEVMKMYGAGFRRFQAERYTFIMLNLSEHRQAAQTFRWAWKAIGSYPLILFSPRFMASLKNTLFS